MRILSAGSLFLTLTGGAQAGGFDRFQRDETLLFDQAGIVIDVSGSYATAAGSYRSVNGFPEQVDIGESSKTGAVRLKVSRGDAACLGAITEPFRTDLSFGSEWSQSAFVTEQHLRVVEIGATCSLRLKVPSGEILPLVGVSSDQLVFEQYNLDTLGNNEKLLDLGDHAVGWRIGGAFVHSSGITASVVYYSALHFKVDGILRTQIDSASVSPTNVAVTGSAEFPQTLRFDLSVPINKSWLISFAGQWADWSALDHVSLQAASATPLWQPGTELLDLKTFFRDGYTASILVGHAFTADWAAWARVSWDRATTTGWTEHSSARALQLGVRHRLSPNLELSAAVTGVSVADTDLNKRHEGAPYDAGYKGEFLFIPQVSLTHRF